MAKSRNVFIYNGTGTSNLSVFDLNEFFTVSKHIFPVKPDVSVRNFNFNMDGLVNPVFVVPGGSSIGIAMSLKSSMKTIKTSFKNDDYSYVGICAGAFLGVSNADLYITDHSLSCNSKTFAEKNLFANTQQMELSFNIMNDYQAFGALYPDHSHIDVSPQLYMPYCVNLSLNTTHYQCAQLYVAGPAFIPSNMHRAESRSEVVATYTQSHQFTLFGNQKKETHPLAAIVRRRASADKGGVFLAGTHIETCVNNSKLLNFFKTSTRESHSLDPQKFARLQEQQQASQKEMETLLSETLNAP